MEIPEEQQQPLIHKFSLLLWWAPELRVPHSVGISVPQMYDHSTVLKVEMTFLIIFFNYFLKNKVF